MTVGNPAAGGFGSKQRTEAGRAAMMAGAGESARSQAAYDEARKVAADWKTLTEKEQAEWAKLSGLDRAKAETAYIEANFPFHAYLKDQGFVVPDGPQEAETRGQFAKTTRFVREPGGNPRYLGDPKRGGEEVQVTLKVSGQARSSVGGEPGATVDRDRWVWTRPDGTAAGGVIGWMRDVEGRGQGAGKSGQMAQIKAHIKQVMTGRDYNKAASNGLLAATDGVAERLRREGDTGEIGRLERREGGGKPEASDVEKSERGFPSVQQRWAQCRPGINPYLRDERGIREDVLRTFQHGIRNEPEGETRFLVGFCAVKKDADGKDVTTPSGYKVRVQENARGFCAAHTTEGGEVVGFERKGPRANPEDKRAFSKFSVLDHTRGERKGITRLTNVPKDAPINRVYAGESVVDLLSIYQHDGQPSGVVLSSTYGQTTDAAFAELGKLASRHPGAEIHLAFDSDGKGAEFARKASEAITKFNPEANIVSRQPPAAFKDWNDALLLKTRSELSPEDAAKAKADMRAEALVNEAQGIDTKRLQLWTAAKEGDLTPDEHDTEIGKLNRRMADLTRAEAAYRIEFGHSALEHAARTAAKPSEGLHVKAALQTPPAAQKSSFVRSGSFQGGQEPRVPGGHSISQ